MTIYQTKKYNQKQQLTTKLIRACVNQTAAMHFSHIRAKFRETKSSGSSETKKKLSDDAENNTVVATADSNYNKFV